MNKRVSDLRVKDLDEKGGQTWDSFNVKQVLEDERTGSCHSNTKSF